MKGRETKEGKHHRAQATQTQGRDIEIEKPRERKRAKGRQRGRVENRKEKSPSSSSSKRASRRRNCLSARRIISPSLPSHTCSLHPSIHPSIYSLQHASTLPSFLPFNIVTNHLHLMSVCIYSSRLPFSPPVLPLCFILLAGNKRSDGQ